jgi:hypothetical protein
MTAGEGRDGMLSPYRALDLTGEMGLLCGKMLGDLGVDVVGCDDDALKMKLVRQPNHIPEAGNDPAYR